MYLYEFWICLGARITQLLVRKSIEIGVTVINEDNEND